MHDADLLLFQWISGGFNPQPQLLVLARGMAGAGAWLAALGLLVAAWRQPRSRVYLVGVVMASSVAAAISHGLAAAIRSPRPFMLGLSPAWVAHGASGSMPSTHATVMAIVAFMCMARAELRLEGVGIAILTLLTGWARVYAGVHFPLDIVAGCALGAGLGALIRSATAATSRMPRLRL